MFKAERILRFQPYFYSRSVLIRAPSCPTKSREPFRKRESGEQQALPCLPLVLYSSLRNVPSIKAQFKTDQGGSKSVRYTCRVVSSVRWMEKF